jgi:hypothetical protein
MPETWFFPYASGRGVGGKGKTRSDSVVEVSTGFKAKHGSGLNRLRFLSDWLGSGRRERPEAESVGNASQPAQDWEIKRRSAASAVDLFGRESGFSGE